MSLLASRHGFLFGLVGLLCCACGSSSGESSDRQSSGNGQGGATEPRHATGAGSGTDSGAGGSSEPLSAAGARSGADLRAEGGRPTGSNRGSNVGGSAGTTAGTSGAGATPDQLPCAPKRFPKDVSCKTNNFVSETGGDVNWAEAMQKALWFFGANRSGSGLTCGDVQWRGDTHLEDARIALDPDAPNGVDLSRAYIDAHRAALDPDGNGTVDLSGGYYDGGDYLRFGLPSAYAATMIAWGMYEFPSAYSRTKLELEALTVLRNFAEYFMRGTFFEGDEIVAFAHQVGDLEDHACGWMPPELRLPSMCPRKGYFATHETPAADVVATASAALTLIGEVYRRTGSDVAFADRCLRYAKSLYRFAKLYPETKATTSGGIYETLDVADKLAWSALWLSIVTGEDSYLDDIVGDLEALDDGAVWAKGYLSKFPGFQTVDSIGYDAEPYAWNNARAAFFVKFAPLLALKAQGIQEWLPLPTLSRSVRQHAWYVVSSWLDGSVAERTRSPGGFSMVPIDDEWDSGRDNASAQFLSLVYVKAFADEARAQEVKDWARSQSEYLLGRNPLGKSYMVGFTGKYCDQPHHAAAHASPFGTVEEPLETRHILWGALVNGPANPAKDEHVDRRGDFASNAVTIGNNSALLSALAANYVASGSTTCPIPDFPPIEPATDEFFAELTQPTTVGCLSQTQLTLVNASVHPPRYDEHLSARFYIDVSELVSAGVNPSTVTFRKLSDLAGEERAETTLTGPLPCQANPNLWYVELGYEGAKFWGANPRLSSPRTMLLEYGTGTKSGCIWDPSNDYSTRSLSSSEPQKTPRVTVYSRGKLIFGEEPTCQSP